MAEEQTNQTSEENKEESSEEVKTEGTPTEEKKDEEVKPEEPKKEEAPKEEEKKPEPKPEPEKKEEEEVEVPKKFEKLVEEIEKMSVLDLAELVKILEKKFGVSAAAPVAMAPAGAVASSEAGAGEEKSVFNIELTGVGDKKIEVIKAVRDITEKGLKEAKDLVDAAASASQVVKENVKKDEAEEIKKKLTDAGATVELK
ncbi:50S ribosomal protein L7/L12 [Candidatus Parcubacteria bacterium]|nr:50S ribosomal protein L7/L12 [Candidatus Parcubacteria bacterium]